MKNKKSGTIDAVETWRPWCIFTYTIEEKGGDLSKIGYIKVNKDTKCCSLTNDKNRKEYLAIFLQFITLTLREIPYFPCAILFAVCLMSGTRQKGYSPCATYKAHGKHWAHGEQNFCRV